MVAVNDVGGVEFNVADRLAIINLLGAYAYTYDQDRLDDFRALFTEAPELVLWHEGQVLSSNIDTVMSFLKARKAAFNSAGNRRRHALNSFWFTSQSATEATGHCYVQVFAVRVGGPPSPELTACYNFTAARRDGVWRLSRWAVTADQREVGMPDRADT